MKRTFLIFAILLFIMTACQTQVEPSETAALSVTATPSATALPPTATVEPSTTSTGTMISTITPITLISGGVVAREGTVLPEVEPITMENLDQLQEIAQWGKGTLLDVGLNSGETQVVAATTIGIYWFDVETMEELNFVPYAFDWTISSIKLSPSTKNFIFNRNDGFLRYGETDTGEILYEIEQRAGQMWFSPDGQNILIESGDIKIWNIAEEIWETESYTMLHDWLIVNSLGSHFVGVYWDENMTHYIDGEQKEITANSSIHRFAKTISNNGQYMVFESEYDAYIQVIDIETDSVLMEYCLDTWGCMDEDGDYFNTPEDISSIRCPCQYDGQGYTSRIISAEFTPDDRYLLLTTDEECGIGQYLYRIDMLAGQILSKETIPQAGNILPFSDNERFVIWEQKISTHRIQKGGTIAETTRRFSMYGYSDISPDGKLIGNMSPDGNFRLYDIQSGAEVLQQSFSYKSSKFIFFNDQNKVFFTHMPEFAPAILNFDTGELEVLADEQMCFVDYLAISPDDQILLTSVWSTEKSILYSFVEKQWNWFEDPGKIRAHPNKPEFALTADAGLQIFTFDGLNMTPQKTIPADFCGYWWRDSRWGYMPDGEEFYCLAQKETTEEELYVSLYVFSDETVQEISPDIDPRLVQSNLAFSADGSMFFIANLSNQVLVYHTQSGSLIATLDLQYSIRSINASPDGKYVAISTLDGLLHIWGVPIE